MLSLSTPTMLLAETASQASRYTTLFLFTQRAGREIVFSGWATTLFGLPIVAFP